MNQFHYRTVGRNFPALFYSKSQMGIFLQSGTSFLFALNREVSLKSKRADIWCVIKYSGMTFRTNGIVAM